MTIDQTVGFIAHLPLTAILKGSQGVEFELVAVGLQAAHLAARTLHELATLDLSSGFTIAPPSSPEVEAPAGDAGPHAASPATPHTLTGWRTAAASWDALKVEAFTAYRFEHGITKDATPDERLAAYEAFHAVYAFTDVNEPPAPRDIPVTPDAPVKRNIDEGAEVDADVVSLAGQRYGRLDDVVRSWVSLAAASIRLNPDSGGQATERRATLLGALCELAEQGMDDDDAVRAIASHVGLGDAAWQGAPIASVVAALSVTEAHQFAAVASLVCMTIVPFEFFEDQAARCVLSSELAA